MEGRDETMRDPIDKVLGDWLEAERCGEAEAADAALASLFQGLPGEKPSPGFAEGVLARAREAGALAHGAAASTDRSRVSMAARLAAVWLAAMSLAALMASSYLVSALPRLDLGLGIHWLVRAVSESWQWLASGVVLWRQLAEYGRLMTKVVEVPEVSALLLVSLVISIVAFRLLQAILRDERKWTYAQQRQ